MKAWPLVLVLLLLTGCVSEWGTLTVESNPKTALYINQQYRGQTPVTISRLNQGWHQIRLEAEGYVPYQETVYIEANRSYHMKRDLALDMNYLPWMTPGRTFSYQRSSGTGIKPLYIRVLEVEYVGNNRFRSVIYWEGGDTVYPYWLVEWNHGFYTLIGVGSSRWAMQPVVTSLLNTPVKQGGSFFGLTVTGKETVTVPAGTFSTWRATDYQGTTIWFTPQIGIVKWRHANGMTDELV